MNISSSGNLRSQSFPRRTLMQRIGPDRLLQGLIRTWVFAAYELLSCGGVLLDRLVQVVVVQICASPKFCST